MTTRQEKVNSLLQRKLSDYILTERFEGITGLLTLTGVQVTADMEHAKVFFSVVGQDEDEVLKILEAHLYEIQGFLYKALDMRQVPRLAFVADTSGKYAQAISELLHKIHDDKKEYGDNHD